MVDEGDDLGGGAQDARGGPVVIDERLHKSRRACAIAARNAGEALQENGEAPERGAAKAVYRLRVVAYGDDVAMVRGELPEQLDLGDVGVLEFVHQDVAITCAERAGKSRFAAKQMDGVEHLHAKREQVALAKQMGWNVPTQTARPRSPAVRITRCFISPAALSVKVRARMASPGSFAFDS